MEIVYILLLSIAVWNYIVWGVYYLFKGYEKCYKMFVYYLDDINARLWKKTS